MDSLLREPSYGGGLEGGGPLSLMASLGRVLVIDDEPEIVRVLRDALQEFGYTVKIALTGREALGLIDVYRPDVVLLDLLMPGIPGKEVLKELKQHDPSLPVIVVTANRDEDLGRAVLAAAFDYLPKPFRLDVLERLVAAAIAARGLAAQ